MVLTSRNILWVCRPLNRYGTEKVGLKTPEHHAKNKEVALASAAIGLGYCVDSDLTDELSPNEVAAGLKPVANPKDLRIELMGTADRPAAHNLRRPIVSVQLLPTIFLSYHEATQSFASIITASITP